MKLSKGKLSIILIMTAAAAAGLWWIVWGRKKAATAPAPADQTTTPQGAARPRPATGADAPPPPGAIFIRKGDKNNGVKKIQAALNDKTGAGLVVDGIFGAKTAAALDKWKPGTGKGLTVVQFTELTGK